MSLDPHFYYKKDRLNQVRGFCATVKCDCSQVRAAEELHVEPATINKQIASLERDLKINLFKRENVHRLSLTDEGLAFYQEIVVAVQKIDSIFNNFFEGIKIKQAQEIKIAAHHTIFVYLVPQYINKFKKTNPSIKFILKNIPLKNAVDSLLADTIDIALYPIEYDLAGCDATLLYDLDPMLLVNKNNPLVNKRDKEITFDDLAKENLMMIDEEKILPYFKNVCKEFKLDSFIKFKETDWEMIRNYVKLNLGVHLYSDLYNIFPMFKDPDILTKNVSHLFPNIKINAITKAGKIQNDNIKNFLKMIKEDF